ncbi:unnamed protein product [Effrenium voratum]|nr:unnamed protein product [Effrenium voratum]
MASEPSSEVEELEDDLEIPVPEPEWKRPRVSVLRKPAGKFGECEHGLFLTKCVKCHGCPHGGLRSFCQTCKKPRAAPASSKEVPTEPTAPTASEPESSEVEELDDFQVAALIPEPEAVSVLRKPAGSRGQCEHGFSWTKCVKCHGTSAPKRGPGSFPALGSFHGTGRNTAR